MSRVAIVTGGISGIGRATAAQLVADGVSVAVFGRAGDDPVDVSDPQAVERGVERVRATLGPIDIVVNAAGIPAGGTVEDETYPETWQRTLDVNLTGAMHVVRACVPDLVAGGRGRIVNVASTEALAAGRRTGPYTVAKTALVALTALEASFVNGAVIAVDGGMTAMGR